MTGRFDRTLAGTMLVVALTLLGIDRLVASGTGARDEGSAGPDRMRAMTMPSYEGAIGQDDRNRAIDGSDVHLVMTGSPAASAREWFGHEPARAAQRRGVAPACATGQVQAHGSSGLSAAACLMPPPFEHEAVLSRPIAAAADESRSGLTNAGATRTGAKADDRPNRTRHLLAAAGFAGGPQAPPAEDFSFAAPTVCPSSQAGSPSPVIGRVRAVSSMDRGPFAAGFAVDLPHHCGLRANVDGTVVFSGVFGNYGPLLIIAHDDEYHSLVAGMVSLAVDVGDQISRNQLLGRVDRGEYGTERVHVEVRRSGSPVDAQSHVGRFATKAQG